MGAFLYRGAEYLGEIPYPVVRETASGGWEVEGDWKGTPPCSLAGTGGIEIEVRPRRVVPVRTERVLRGGRAAWVRGTRVLIAS